MTVASDLKVLLNFFQLTVHVASHSIFHTVRNPILIIEFLRFALCIYLLLDRTKQYSQYNAAVIIVYRQINLQFIFTYYIFDVQLKHP